MVARAVPSREMRGYAYEANAKRGAVSGFAVMCLGRVTLS